MAMTGHGDRPSGLVKAFSASCLKAASRVSSETKRLFLSSVPKSTSQTCVVDAVRDLQLNYDTFGQKKDPAVLLIMGLAAQKVRYSSDFCQGIAEAGYYVIRFDNRDCGKSSRYAETVLGRLGSVIGMPQLAMKKTFKERKLIIMLLYIFAGRLVWMQRKRRYKFSHAITGAAFLFLVLCRPLIPYSCEDLAFDCIQLLDNLGVMQSHVVGFSLGGMIAQVLHRTHPRRCLSLILMGSCHPNAAIATADLPWTLAHIVTSSNAFSMFSSSQQRQEGLERFWQNLASPGKKRDAQRKKRQKVLASEEVARRSQHVDAMLRQTMAVLKFTMGGLPCSEPPPTLVIHGLQDPLIPVCHGLELAKVMQCERCVVLPDLGHDLLPAGEKEIHAAIIAHLADVTVSKISDGSTAATCVLKNRWDTLKKSPSVTLFYQNQDTWAQDISS